MQNGRTNFTIRNTYIGLIGQIATYVFTFAFRTIFILTLGERYLGVQGLFSNILSLLSLAELGVGSAITFSLYKPLAEKDISKIKSLMNFYARTYRMIGMFIAITGITLAPFLGFFIRDMSGIDNIRILYLLYLADSVISYFWSYKRSIISAYQKNYINTIQMNAFTIIRSLIQMIVLLVYRQFIPVLIIQILSTLFSNITISIKANKMYPYLRDSDVAKLDKNTHYDLIKKIKAMMLHQLGSVLVLGTDNLLISKFISIIAVGVYSNYLLIIGIIRSLITQFTQAVVASIGNLVSTESDQLSKKVFDMLFFLNFWIYSFSTVCLLTLFNPFISIWLGSKYTFSFEIVCVIVINFFISGMRQNTLAFKNVLGLFYNDRFKPIFESIINLVASMIFLYYLGIIGVFLGTLLSTITTSLWIEPYVLFKHYFKHGLFGFWKRYVFYILVTIIVSVVMLSISSLVFNGSIQSFLILFVLCLIVPNLIFYLFFSKTEQYYLCSQKIHNIFLRLD